MSNSPDPALLAGLRARWAAKPTQILIGGQWSEAASGETFETFEPSTGTVLARSAAGDAADVDRAVAAARAAFEGPWSKSTPSQRTRLLLKLADLIERDGDEIALTETLDVGRPIALSRMIDVGGSVEQLRYNAGWASKLAGETNELSAPGEWLAYSLREPVGVVAQIVPWNFPLIMAVAKLAPAIAAGCTVIIKPAEQTPLSTVKLGELICEAGFPDGVVNIVTGLGRTAGAALAAHHDVDKVSFTGSTQTGRAIIDAAKGNFKRVALELGGKSPTFIFADADLERAIPAAAMGIFSNAGQVCAAGSRLFVHEKVADQVLEGVTRMAQALRVGPSLALETQIGPIISQTQLDRVLGYIGTGQEEGARLLTGGGRIGTEGYFVQPTVLVDAKPDMRVVREEIFGPVLSAMRFGDDDDVDALARRGNDSDYGLAASIHTRDIGTAHKLARRLKAGTVRVNGSGGVDPSVPLGGYKQSGWGRENGRAGVESYTEIKVVTVSL